MNKKIHTIYLSATLLLANSPSYSRELSVRSATMPSDVAAFFEPSEKFGSIHLATGLGSVPVCAAEGSSLDWYPGAGISVVTGSIPFIPVVGGDRSCIVEIEKLGSIPSKLPVLQKYSKCYVGLERNNKIRIGALSPIAKKEDVPLGECFYRLALLLEGYSGAMNKLDWGEYSDEFPFTGKVRSTGRIVSTFPAKMIVSCPNIVKYYYKATLKNAIIQNCVSFLDRKR